MDQKLPAGKTYIDSKVVVNGLASWTGAWEQIRMLRPGHVWKTHKDLDLWRPYITAQRASSTELWSSQVDGMSWPVDVTLLASWQLQCRPKGHLLEAVHCNTPSTCSQTWSSNSLTGIAEIQPQWASWNWISISEVVPLVTWTNMMLFCPLLLDLSLLPPPFFLSFFLLVCRTSLDTEKWSKSYWEKFNLHPAVGTVLWYHTMEKCFILSEQGIGQHFSC